MCTRSSARNLFPPLDNPELTIRRRSRADPTLLNDFEMAAEGNAQRSESSSSITYSFDMESAALKAEMVEINKNLMRVLQVNQQVKAVTPNCETCGGPHSFNDCPATVGLTENVYATGAYQAGSEIRPPMLNKENYVHWSSRLLRYAKSRPNGKLIYNSILNGPYIEADDQAIQTILLGLPEDIYAAVDSYETAQEIWLRVQQMMKGADIGIQEKKAKLFNEWEMFTSNEGGSIDLNGKEVDELKAERIAKTQDPLALMENSNNPYAFPAPHQDQSSLNQNYLQQPMQNPKDITDPTTAMNMALSLMAKAFKLNYSTPTTIKEFHQTQGTGRLLNRV
nr:hypothetical protein [Tanacetum cinerariifolium]